MTSTEIPERGEIWLVAFGAARSGKPGKTRPAVVMTPSELNPDSPRALFAVVPLSASATASPVAPMVSADSGVDSDSRAITQAVRGLARGRFHKRIGVATAREMASIGAALEFTLGLHDV